jgi:predicted GH43/DUF377 family glycosyl hydrolase
MPAPYTSEEGECSPPDQPPILESELRIFGPDDTDWIDTLASESGLGETMTGPLEITLECDDCHICPSACCTHTYICTTTTSDPVQPAWIFLDTVVLEKMTWPGVQTFLSGDELGIGFGALPSPDFDDAESEAWVGRGQSYYQPGPDVIGYLYIMVWCEKVYDDEAKTRLVGRRYRYRGRTIAFDPYSSVGGSYEWMRSPLVDGHLDGVRCVSKVFSTEPPLQVQIFEADSIDIPVPPIEDWLVPNPNPPSSPPDGNYPYYAYPPGGTVTLGPWHFYDFTNSVCGDIKDDPPDPPLDPWWIKWSEDPLVPEVTNVFDPPTNWISGPWQSEAIATYWMGQVTDGPYYCVQWHDHEGDPEDLPSVSYPDNLPIMIGALYIYCMTQAEIDAAIEGSTTVVIESRTYYYNCPPRPGDDKTNLRRATIIDGPWWGDLEEVQTFDGCPEQPSGVDECPADPDNGHPDPFPRWTFDSETELPWMGFVSRQTGLEKCQQSCPMCSRLRKCLIITADGAVLVDEPADKGTDWRGELPAVRMNNNLTISNTMYWSAAFCGWICSNPCNQQLFPEFCGDPDAFPGDFLGCEERPRPIESSLPDSMTFAGPAPSLTERDVKIVKASTKTNTPIRLTTTTENASLALLPCDHRKEKTGQWRMCKTCGNSLMLAVYGCGIHGQCLVNAVEGNIKSCATCPDRVVQGVATPAPQDESTEKKRIKLYEKESRGKCAYVGDLIEKAVGCDGGPRCVFECDHPNEDKRNSHPKCIPLDRFVPAKKGGCPHWSSYVQPDEVTTEVIPIPIPKRIVRISREGLASVGGVHFFNGSVIRYKGRLLFAYRTGWAGSEVAVAELNENYEVLQSRILPLRHDSATVGREDPRLFLHHNRLHVSFVGVKRIRGAIATNQLFARISDDLHVEDVFAPSYLRRKAWEKNWTFFEYLGALYAVYEVLPRHRILLVRGGAAGGGYSTSTSWEWTGGHLRGGAPPVLVGDEYICWVHGAADAPHPMTMNGRRRYSVGIYAFEAKPPFRVTRVTKDPILWADPTICPDPAAIWADVVFPAGAIFENDMWKVSLGVHDRWNEIHEWSAKDVDRLLKPVSSYPPMNNEKDNRAGKR